MKKSLLLLLLLSLCPWPRSAGAQTLLQAGDVLLLGYQTQGSTDFAFVSLVDLEPGTQLYFTDEGWKPDGEFRAGEGIVTYTAPSEGVPSGTVVGYQAQAADFTHPPQFELRPSGDQVLAYQGKEDKPTFVCALTYGKNWSPDVSPRDSQLPPGLKTGHSALYLPLNNGAYADDSPHKAVADDLRANLTNPNRWTSLDGQAVALQTQRLIILPPQPIHEPVRLPAPPPGADSLRLLLYHTLGSLDVSLVPTGYLAGYGLGLVPLAALGGTLADSNRTSAGLWRQAFATIATSRVVGAHRLPRLDTLGDRLDRPQASGAIPIALARIDYAAFRPDAVTAGLLSLQNGQLYDVPGRSQSPYEVKTLFVAGPARTGSSTGNVSFVFPSDLHVQEGGGRLRLLELDFGAGQGYQTAAFDQPLALAYCAGTYRVKVRASYYLPASTGTSGPYVAYESHFDFVVQDATCGALARYADAITPVNFPAQFIPPAAHPNFGATVYVRYGGGAAGTPTHHSQLTKPLIVVEGYDPYFAAGSLTEDKNGVRHNYSISDFLDDIGFATDGASTPVFNFGNSLDNTANYDIVFVDFTNGTDDIRRNAEVFKRVLRWVNSTKVTDPGTGNKHQNAVLGISMGGLVARYGLAQMVKDSEDPDTYILATQDSPHRGANTPLGVQALTRQGYNAANLATVAFAIIPGLILRAIFPKLDDAVTLLDEPATQQLVLLRATGGTTGNYSNNSFINDDYQPTVTFPANGPQPGYRFVAASLGSECGTPTLAPHAELIKIDGGAFLGSGNFKAGFLVATTVNALPNYSAPDRVSVLRLSARVRLFFGIQATVTLFSQTFDAPGYVPCWDGLPGGTQSISSQLPLSPGPHSFGGWLLGGSSYVEAVDRFCFVPTASALDIAAITTSTLQGRYVGGVASTSYSRAATFIAEPRGFDPGSGGQASNFLHPFFRGRQAHWLFNELERVPGSTATNPILCASNPACPVTTQLAITGPTEACGVSSVTFAATDIPGATYSWTANPNDGGTPITGTGPTFQLNLTNATVPYHIYVTATTPCRAFTSVQVLQVCPALHVEFTENTTAPPLCVLPGYGTPSSPNASSYGNSVRCEADVHGGTQPYTYAWYVEYGAPGQPCDFTPTLSNTTPALSSPTATSYALCLNGHPTATITLRVTDATGAIESYTQCYTDRGSTTPHDAVFPNPADASVTIANLDADGYAVNAPFTVTIYDRLGNQVLNQSVSSGTLNVDTTGFPNGLYHVVIDRGYSMVTNVQLVVQH